MILHVPKSSLKKSGIFKFTAFENEGQLVDQNCLYDSESHTDEFDTK